MKNILTKFVRERKTKRPIGVVVAIADGGEVSYGWSLCRRTDKWDNKFGKELAVERAVPINVLALNALENKVPRTVAKDLTAMIYRSKAYFHQM
jgi:hypothetical protein